MSDKQEFSLDTARAAARAGDLGTWVPQFLASPGSDNAELGAMLCERVQCWTGPVKVPLHHLHRLAGPPDSPALCPVDEDYWDERVSDMAERIEDDWVPPPVIATYRDGQLVLEDGNHRVESLRQAGKRQAWTLVGFDRPADLDRFEAEHGTGPT